jgi:hypothetical protein
MPFEVAKNQEGKEETPANFFEQMATGKRRSLTDDQKAKLQSRSNPDDEISAKVHEKSSTIESG